MSPGIYWGLWGQGPGPPGWCGMGWDGVRVWVVPSSVGPRAGQGQGCGGARLEAWAGSSPRRASPCLPIPWQPPFQDLLKPGPFLLQETPILPRAPPLAAEVLPCLAACKQTCTHQEMAFSQVCPRPPQSWQRGAGLGNPDGAPELSCYQKGEKEAGAQPKQLRNDGPWSFPAAKLSAKTGD